MATTAKGIASTTNLEKISDAISSYITKIDNSASKLGVTGKQMQKAIKGTSSETKLTNALSDIKSQINTYTKELEKYKTVIEKIAASYKSNDENNESFNNILKNLQSESGE